MPSPVLARWLKSALKYAEMSQVDMSKALTKRLGRSFDKSAVNKMTKGGREIKADEAFAISEITGHPLPESATDVTTVPLLSWVSAGRLAEPTSQIPVEDVPLLAFADLGRGDFFALKIEGDSMDRISPEGSTIIVNRADRTPVAGKPFVFAVRGETTYKLWQPNEPAYLAPHSTNPGHKPIFVKRKRDLEVIGRVKRTILDL